MEAGRFDPARTDPEKLAEVSADLQEAAEIGERINALVAELGVASTGLRALRDRLPYKEDAFRQVSSGIVALKRHAEFAFGGISEELENPTYLGNLASAKHFREVQAASAKHLREVQATRRSGQPIIPSD